MKTISRNKNIPDAYMELIRELPLRPIRSEADYQRAIAMVDKLAARDENELDSSESDYLDVLSDLIEAYEDVVSTIDRARSTPVGRLQALMRSSGISTVQLAEIMGVTPALVSMLLSGKRALSKAGILKLAEHFRLDPGYFM